jgi:8-oxo-dGTP pyrophosphatase MutT (NUDIX family)
MSKGVQPAATVIVLRPRGADDLDPELYMLRRSSKSAFMPDALVFPGGRVEDEDHQADGPGDVDSDALELEARLDRAFAQAARRECMEEASLAVEPAALRWIDTWQTPSGESPRRFLARFFLTQIPPDAGHDAVADGVETRAGRWATAGEILAQWEREEVELPPPTLSILLGIEAGDWPQWLTRSAAQVRAPILPKIAAVESSIHIVMPHDPEYASLPGESGEVPERARTFPRRFIRTGKRWVPAS